VDGARWTSAAGSWRSTCAGGASRTSPQRRAPKTECYEPPPAGTRAASSRRSMAVRGMRIDPRSGRTRPAPT
jgi:hypothetical protein